MRNKDVQLGLPDVLYTDTKAAIEGLVGVTEGAQAYATDTDQYGAYDGAAWSWVLWLEEAALHDNIASEIWGIAEKDTPVDADIVVIEDSADSWAKKKVELGNLPGGGGGGDSVHTDVYASRPAASNDGDLFLPSDGFVIERDTGAAWVPWGPIFPLSISGAPTTWVNQNDSVLTTNGGGQNLYDPVQANTNPNDGFLVKAAPATPYTIDALFLFTVPFRIWNYNTLMMFGWRDSGTGKLSMFRIISHTNTWRMNHLKASSPTTDVANYLEETIDMCSPMWARIKDDGTDFFIYISPDGQNWTLFHTIGRTDYLADPDQVLWGMSSRGTVSPGSTTLVSWEEG